MILSPRSGSPSTQEEVPVSTTTASVEAKTPLNSSLSDPRVVPLVTTTSHNSYSKSNSGGAGGDGGGGGGGGGKSKNQFGNVDEGADLPQPPIWRSQSAPPPTKTVLVQDSVTGANQHVAGDNTSPWLGIWKLLTHPSVYATEPDKQVSNTDRALYYNTCIMQHPNNPNNPNVWLYSVTCTH
jgi:hypothetical protein